jgi:undecaprenyl diphosphate synthase
MHIGFIMDGNRRWAHSKLLPQQVGHARGAQVLRPLLQACVDTGVHTISMWVLARQNMSKRSPEELSYIYQMVEDKCSEIEEEFIEKGIRFCTIGNLSLLPTSTQDRLQATVQATASGTKLTVIMAIAYGGQDEIIRGIHSYIHANASQLATDVGREALIQALTAESFALHLDTGEYSTPDLIIRTGGDVRHSGYWLYGCEYSEYYFTPTLWPDFSVAEFHKALDAFRNARRNYGA